MSLSFHATFLCRFKKRWFEEQIFEAAKAVKSESIAASMLYQVLFTAVIAAIFTDEYTGITEVTSLFVWRCVSRLEEKGSECTAPTINEETLQTAVVKAINELLANKEPFLQALQKNIATILNEENDNATNDIDSKLEELQQQLLIQAKSKNDYEDVADEIYHLRELKQNALVENAEREGKRQRIAEMTDFFNEQSCELEVYDEQLVRRLIEKVTVFHDKFAVEFKSGVEIDVEG